MMQNAGWPTDFFLLCEKLKETKRYARTPAMPIKESVADHSWKLAVMVFVVKDAYNIKVDVTKAMKIALVHDLVEAVAGDTDYSLVFNGRVSTEDKKIKELEGMRAIKKSTNSKLGDEIEGLWLEYENGTSEEGKYVKALDKIEGIDHPIYRKMLEQDPEMLATYADKAISNFPELLPLLKETKIRLKALYEENGISWKDKFNYGLK